MMKTIYTAILVPHDYPHDISTVSWTSRDEAMEYCWLEEREQDPEVYKPDMIEALETEGWFKGCHYDYFVCEANLLDEKAHL